MESYSVWFAAIGLLITFSTLLANALYKSGHLSARVEELEHWRSNMRADMHEISDKLEAMTNTLHALHTIIEERTEKRSHPREVLK